MSREEESNHEQDNKAQQEAHERMWQNYSSNHRAPVPEYESTERKALTKLRKSREQSEQAELETQIKQQKNWEESRVTSPQNVDKEIEEYSAHLNELIKKAEIEFMKDADPATPYGQQTVNNLPELRRKLELHRSFIRKIEHEKASQEIKNGQVSLDLLQLNKNDRRTEFRNQYFV